MKSNCKDSAYGPYLTEIPQNPFVVDGQVVFAKESNVGVDWVIDVKSNTVLDGRPEGEFWDDKTKEGIRSFLPNR